MRVLITGGAGHLGPGVCQAFLREGFDLRALLHRKRIKGPGPAPEVVWGDITRPESVREAVREVDAVVHMAGLVQPLTERKPELASRVNVGGTQTIVDIIRERGESIPFVFTSSGAVYGPCPDATGCLHPDRDSCNPTSVYAATKVQAEEIIRESGIDYVILRLTSIPYQRIGFADMKDHMFTIPLENRLEFCHPDDMATATVNAVKRFDAVRCTTLMIGGGPSQQVLYQDMLRVLFAAFSLPLPPAHKFAQEPFPLHWYDTSESQELLQYQRRTLDDYAQDLAKQLPAPLTGLMRHLIGPALGRLIVRML